MNASLKVVTAPAEEPVTAAEAKTHLRISGTDQDTPIANMIIAARKLFEEQTGSTVISTVYDFALDAFPAGPIVLPRATPLISVTSIKYTDSDGTENTWASGEYALDLHSKVGSVRPDYNESYPSFTPHPVNPIMIRYTAGAANAAAVDQQIKNWILLTVGALYEYREMLVDGTPPRDLGVIFSGLLNPHRAEWQF